MPDAIDNPMYFKEGQVEGAGAGTGYMAVEPDWLSEQWDMLSDQPWFRGFQNRDECEQELNAYPPGGYASVPAPLCALCARSPVPAPEHQAAKPPPPPLHGGRRSPPATGQGRGALPPCPPSRRGPALAACG